MPRHRLTPVLYMAILAGCAGRGPSGIETAAPVSADAAPADPSPVVAVADTYYTELLAFAPTIGTWLGLEDARHDLLGDPSFAAETAWNARTDTLLARLRRVDASRLPPGDRVLQARLIDDLQSGAAMRVCRFGIQGVSQNGIHMSLAALARVQPVGTADLRRAALTRFAQVPRHLDVEIDRLEVGLAGGYTVPRRLLTPTLQQLDDILALPVDSSPFMDPAARDSTPEFRRALRELVEDGILPALVRYRTFLRDRYAPAARSTIGIAGQPDGAECYGAMLRGYSSVDLSPDSVFAIGERQMLQIESELEPLVERLFPGSSVADALEGLRSDTAFTFRTRAEMVVSAESALARAKAAMPQWFGRLPKADVVVEPCDAFEEAAACPGSYESAAKDGSRPGVYRINTAAPETQPRAIAESITFHETIPGHHLEFTLSLEDTLSHPVSRILGTGSYSEGWALYAERLADEMQLYSGDLDRIGMLSSQALRAARLVVDVGLHLHGWTPDQALEYLIVHTAEPRDYLASEVDRYISNPGQATSYMLGQLEIMRLRDDARRRMGAAFDIREFHDVVLEKGSVPLPLLGEQVEAWVVRSTAPMD